jgi:hypothetical protein
MRLQSKLGFASRSVQAVVGSVVLLFILACSVLRADEVGRSSTPDLISVLETSAPVPVPLKWTASDLFALGFIVLGALVAIIPTPKLRSKTPVQKLTEASVREVCRTATHGSRSSLGADRTPVKQSSTV